MIRFMRLIAVLGVAALSLVSARASAEPGHGRGHGYAVPEINGANAGIALALVAGGAAVVLGRRRKRAS